MAIVKTDNLLIIFVCYYYIVVVVVIFNIITQSKNITVVIVIVVIVYTRPIYIRIYCDDYWPCKNGPLTVVCTKYISDFLTANVDGK